MGSLNNAATAMKRNSVSAWLNTLTAFRDEHCRQSKRKLDVLMHCMKFAFLFLTSAYICTGSGIRFINSKCYSY